MNHRHLSGELRVALVFEARTDLPVHLGLLVSPVIAAAKARASFAVPGNLFAVPDADVDVRWNYKAEGMADRFLKKKSKGWLRRID